MADPLPPDPYLALGVAKDATAAAIKTQYRKLVLKCHPDKVKDESEKKDASDKFHKIQSAWEIIGDEARRARYDAQAKLQELRKDVFGHHGEGRRGGGGGDVRTASYKFPTESPRGGDFYTRGPDRYGPKMSPQYEERMPSYAEEESYFDERPRPAARKYEEYDRSTKRAQPREERERPRAKDSKENDRSSRKEKSRRTDNNVRRDRDRKQAYVEVEPDSDYDEYPRARRSSPEDENLDRVREQFWNSPDPYAREAVDDRARRTFDKMEEAKAHMERSRGVNRQRGESEPRDPSPREAPRPSPVRQSSSKDKIERTKRADVRPSLFNIRHGSGDRPKPTSRNTGTGTGKNSKSDNEKKSSDEERRSSRRKEDKPPTLSKSKSQPADVRPPFQRQRSHSMQDEQHVEEPIPQMRRSETSPLSPSTGVPPSRESRRKANDRLHPDMAYPSPDPTPEPETQKFHYGRAQTYADDGEFATPDGYVNPANAEPYRTQVYEPTRETPRQSARESTRPTRITRSPSPMKEPTDRQTRRSSSGRHTTTAQKPPMSRTTSTQYVVEPDGAYVRPPVSREDSGRVSSRGLSRENSGHKGLYGEIPRAAAARSGSPRQGYTFPPPDDVQYGRRYKESDFKVQSGYSRREPEKPGYSRSGSGLQRQAVYAS